MSQNVPLDQMQDPAPRYVLYPTTRVPSTIPPDVDLSTDFSAKLAEGGFPDLSEANAGIAYAAAQRMAARNGESRAALSGPQAAAASAASAGGPAASAASVSGLPGGAYYGPAPTYYGNGQPGGNGPQQPGPSTINYRTVVDEKGNKQILKAERRQNRLLERLLNRRKHKKG